MQIVSVIPLARGIFKDALTYFSAKELLPGAVVNITVRTKTIPALVVKNEPVDNVRSKLRTADYPVKKIKSVGCEQLLRPAFIEATKKLSRYYAAPLGLVLPNLLPQVIVENSKLLTATTKSEELPPTFKPDLKAIQNNDQERWSTYKSLIREEFAKNYSVVLCAPTHADIMSLATVLKRGIEPYTFILHNKLSKKAIIETWNQAIQVRRPILIIVTPTFMGLPRHDIKTFIIDRESSPAYKAIARPYLDYRLWCEFFAATVGGRVLYGDICLRTETHYRLEQGELLALESIKQRLVTRAKTEIIESQSGDVVNEATYLIIKEAIERSGQVFLLSSRRGLAPLVVCNDCGNPVVCERCDSVVSLHSTQGRHDTDRAYFRCHRCGAERSAREKCVECQSWKLKELGTGTEKIAEIAKIMFPDNLVQTMDSDLVSSNKQAWQIMEKFYTTPGGILVGTEMALHYLHEPVDTSVVVTADSLLSLPDFRINERIFSLLLRLRSQTTRNFVIQTRYPEEALFSFATNGNTIEFYRQELASRREYDYPPFKTLIKVSLEGDREQVRTELKKLAEALATFKPSVYPSAQTIRKERYRLNLLLKLEPSRWPDLKLVALLKSLPPSFIVNIDPHDIL